MIDAQLHRIYLLNNVSIRLHWLSCIKRGGDMDVPGCKTRALIDQKKKKNFQMESHSSVMQLTSNVTVFFPIYSAVLSFLSHLIAIKK